MDAATKDEAATTNRKASSWKRLGPAGLDQPTPEVRPWAFQFEEPVSSTQWPHWWGWSLSCSELTSHSTASGKRLEPSTEAGAELAQPQRHGPCLPRPAYGGETRFYHMRGSGLTKLLALPSGGHL